MTDDVRKIIDDVVDKCKICQKSLRSKSKPSVVITRVSEFNSVVAVDLKKMVERYILLINCAFTWYMKGVVVNDKKPETIMKAIHGTWCEELGFPSVGFWG